MGIGPALIFAAIVIVAVAAAAVVLSFRQKRDAASLPVLDSVSRTLGQLQSELARLGRNQEDLRQEIQRGREASILQLSETAKGLHGEISEAQKALAEMKALEQGRARQLEQASDSLKRLEAVVAGSATRGAAGENILARALAQLPPDLLEINVAFGSRIVEYALRLPGGRFLPIDSKWTSVAILERLDTVAEDQPQERKRLLDLVVRDLRSKIRDMTKYLDPERTLSLGLLAVPDAVYVAAPEAHGEGYREGVLVVPYSLALPYVLALYRLTVRFGCAVDTDQLASRLRQLEEILRRSADQVESRLSRGLVQVENARDALRDNLLEARRATERLLQTAADEPPSAALPVHLPVLMVGERD
jgi:DNA recombination protein RmuC